MDEAVTLAQVERGLTRAVLALAHACESQKVHAYGADYEAASAALATLRAFIESPPSAPRAEAVEARRWQWARSVLTAISYEHDGKVTNVTTTGTNQRGQFWDMLADAAIAQGADEGERNV